MIILKLGIEFKPILNEKKREQIGNMNYIEISGFKKLISTLYYFMNFPNFVFDFGPVSYVTVTVRLLSNSQKGSIV